MKFTNSRRGSTLIECLVTAVILGSGAVGVAGMFACAMVSERKAAHMAQARQIADEALEAVRAGSFGVFDQSSGVTSVEAPGLPRATGALAWEPYSRESDDLKLVAVNLSWDWAASSSGGYRVVTLVSAPGGSYP